MMILLYRLRETEDSFEVGEWAGEIHLDQHSLNVDVADPTLKKNLLGLLAEPIQQASSKGVTLATRVRELYPGDPGYFEALRDRLQKRDFRLLAELPGEP